MDNNIDLRDNNGALGKSDIAVEIINVDGSPYYSDSYVEFLVQVSTGGEPATNIRVWPDFPDAPFIACSGLFNLDGYCEIPAISANSSAALTFSYFNPITIAASAEQHTFSVTAFPGETDLEPGDNKDSVKLSIKPTADMAAQLSLSTAPPYYSGQELQFHLRIVNGGINAATAVDIDVVPNNLSLQWMAGNLCTTANCDIGQMDLFSQENMVLVYRVVNAGAFSLSASVDANQADLVPANNNKLINGTAAQAQQSEFIFNDNFEE